VLSAAREAGAAILSLRASPVRGERKSDGSPVSAADRAASAILGARLESLDPELPVICEEARQDAGGARRFWLIDPLDGTREYLRGSACFSVNIALVTEGFPVFGLVHLPARKLSYWGMAGAGAWRDGEPIHARRVGETPAGLKVLLSPGEPAALTRLCETLLRDRGLHPQIEAVPGAIKFCRLAEGSADLYPRRTRTCAWDTAAGQAILEAAGGTVHDGTGQRMRYRQSPGWFNGDFVAAADAGAGWDRALREALRRGPLHA